MFPKISFKQMMRSRNIDGEIYHSDVDLFTGRTLNIKQRDEIHGALMEMVREKEIVNG
jgi:hypothetical protein